MGKVKLTMEQVNLIEDQRNKMEDYKIVKFFANEVGESSGKFHIDELIRALYVGYEVEEEFKEGDWVFPTRLYSAETSVYKVVETMHRSIKLDHGFSHFELMGDFRHATDEEIATEKQRRFWNGNDRETNEFRANDLFSTKDGTIYEVAEFSKGSPYPVNFINSSGNKDSYKLTAGLKVVCFAEDRKDIN